MSSIWCAEGLPRFKPLSGDVQTDVLIIGGGIAGLLTAYFLRQNGVDCVVAEKSRIASGTTRNTTAKITTQHGLLYYRLAISRGAGAARQYYEANRLALDTYAHLCRQIDCGFEEQDDYVYALTDRQKLENERKALRAIGCPATLCDHPPLPVDTVGALRVPGQAQFDPLRFLAAIVADLPVYENTWVRAMEGTTAVTDTGRIRARRVVVTTHFPFINKHGSYFLKLYQHRSYVIALENAPCPDGMYVDESDTGLSFRRAGELLLLGGGGHRTGKPGGGYEELRTFAATHYPQTRECAHWAAQDCMSLDGIPYIGQYSARTPHLYVATGFNKWGMTGAMTAALLLTGELIGTPLAWADVFSPSRSILHPQLAVNAWESTLGLLYPTLRRCPHLGCALHWNAAEHSWDCACHGSRFSRDGRVLDNPANGDLTQ